MNLERYNAILDAAVDRPLIVGIGIDNIERLVRETLGWVLDAFHRLLNSATFKVSGDFDGNQRFHRQIQTSACRILRALDPGRYYQNIETMRRISQKKNHDYSPFNILAAGSIGVLTRMGDKLARILAAVSSGHELMVSESLADTAMDLVNYSVYLEMVSEGSWCAEDEVADWVRRMGHHLPQDVQATYFSALGPEAVINGRTP